MLPNTHNSGLYAYWEDARAVATSMANDYQRPMAIALVEVKFPPEVEIRNYDAWIVVPAVEMLIAGDTATICEIVSPQILTI